MMVKLRDQSPEAEVYSDAAFPFLKMSRASSIVLIQVDEHSTVLKFTFNLCRTSGKLLK